MIASLSQAIAPWLQVILWTSFYGSVLGLFVLAAQPALRAVIPARFRFALWLLIVVRFVPLPLPESRWSVLNLLPQKRASVAQIEPAPNATAGTLLAPSPTLELPHAQIAAAPDTQAPLAIATSAARSPAPFAISKTPAAGALEPAIAAPPQPSRLPLLITILYLTGTALFLLRLLLATAALRRIIRTAKPASDPTTLTLLDSVRQTLSIKKQIPLLLSDRISGPALAGLFHPRLLLPHNLPAALSAEELRHVFLHELAHLRRRDIPINYAVALLATLHWFNPILWLLLPRIRAERELACDELVLTYTANPAAYGHTLLKLFESATPAQSIAPAVGIIETQSSFTRRIHMIARFRGNSKWTALAAGLFVGAAGIALLTSPVGLVRGDDLEPPATRSAEKTAAQAPPISVPDRGINQSVIAMTPRESAANVATQKKLDAELDSVKFNKVPLEQVLAAMRDKMECNFVVNWKAIEEAGIDRAAPVSVDLAKVPASKALQTVLGQSGWMLAYSVEDGVVTVSTAYDLTSASHLVILVYNVRDLALPPEKPQVEDEASRLIKVIESTVTPDAWRDNGGTVGSISEFKGLLSITGTREMHRQVEDLLKNMRAADKEKPMPPVVKQPVASDPSGGGLFGNAH